MNSTANVQRPEMQGPFKADDFREYYANHLRLGLTPVDVAMTFGRLVEPTPDTARPEEQFTVRFSPQFFKTLVVNLSSLLAAYEGQFGEITISNKTPEEVLAGIKSATESDSLKKRGRAKR